MAFHCGFNLDFPSDYHDVDFFFFNVFLLWGSLFLFKTVSHYIAQAMYPRLALNL